MSQDSDFYTSTDSKTFGRVAEEFENNLLYPVNGSNDNDNLSKPDPIQDLNINNTGIDISKIRGRPTKDCISKLNANEFKDKPFIHDDFLKNQNNIFKFKHYEQCSSSFLSELYFTLKNESPFTKNNTHRSTGALKNKELIINGIHTHDKNIDGIFDLQKKYKKDNINKDTDDSNDPNEQLKSIEEVDFDKLKESLPNDNISHESLYKPTNIDKIIINNPKNDLPVLDNKNKIFRSDFKEFNDYLKELEKKSYKFNLENNNPDFLYPDLDDPNFSIKIAKKKEFYDNRYEDKLYDLREQSELLCDRDFELMPHQTFVKNFLSSNTPYNGLLLFHGVGTGKTCSAIGIAEETRNYFKYTNTNQHEIIIVASPNVQENFKLQLFDKSKLKFNNGSWTLNTCVGNSLLSEINPTNNKNITDKQIIKQIDNLIKSNYNFMGYIEFANFIKRLTFVDPDSGYSVKEIDNIEISRIQKYFNNRLIIIDEVHNIRTNNDNFQKKNTISLLMKIAKYADNMKLLLLSATPMYNSYKEIIWITNLLNLNDKRSIIKEYDVFDDDGNFKDAIDEDSESGKDILQRKLIGYISYLQGENPYSFPYRIYPDVFSPDNILDPANYPNMQLNNSKIDFSLDLPIYTVDFGNYQKNAYQIIIQNLKNYNDNDKLPNFENLESFGYTLLQKPLEALNIVYPKPDIESLFDSNLDTIEKTNIKSKLYDSDKNIDIVGKSGLRRIMNFDIDTSGYKPVKYNYQYKSDTLDKYGRIFSPQVLPNYSSKINTICNNIMNSEGIVLVYSLYIEGGVVPIALALEELGFTKFSTSKQNKPLFKDKPCEPIDALHLKPKKDLDNVNFNPAKYVLITGDSNFSHNNAEDIKKVVSNDNIDGSQIKVVIISKAASEGLDFKNIRQVHILEPWYNLNRIEQIIGRAVRNSSHCMLPFEERNVEIFMYSMNPIIIDQYKYEPADMYLYRLAERKAKQIGRVTRLLKTNAIDCNLNISQTNFSIEKFKEMSVNNIVNIKLSSGKNISFEVGNKPFTAICDYMDNCNIQCKNNDQISESDISSDNFNDFFALSNSDMIIKRIKHSFKERAFFKKNDLINEINKNKTYPIEQILFVLTLFIQNLYVVDNFNRKGHIINKGEFYIFQPIEFDDIDATAFERTNDIDFKHDRIKIELSDNKKFFANQINNNNLVSSSQVDYISIVKNIDSILNDIISNNIDTRKIKANSDWYTEIKSTQLKDYLFNKHSLPIEHFKKYIIFHFLDTSLLSIRLKLLNGLYFKTDNLSFIEEHIKTYFESKMIYKDSSNFAIILKTDFDDSYNFYTLNNNVFIIVDDEHITYSEFAFKKFSIKKSKLYNVIGFMHPFKNDNIVFKIKEFSSKYNNKGSYCKNAAKEDTIRKLNCIFNVSHCPDSLLNEPPHKFNYFYKKEELKNNLRVTGLCIIAEFLFRYFDETDFRNKRYFFSPEETAIINIPDFN